RKRFSGVDYRKRRAEKDAFCESQKGSMLKYVRTVNAADDTGEVEEIGESSKELILPGDEVIKAKMTHGAESDSESSGKDIDNASTVSDIADKKKTDADPNPDDPVKWPKMNSRVTEQLVAKGPTQVKSFEFPKTGNRKFTPNHYMHHLTNGEAVARTWLLYSVSSDTIFCFCCKIFTLNVKSALASDGVRDWKNLSAILSSHEKSFDHISAFQTWKEMEERLNCNKTVDQYNRRTLSAETEHWRNVLHRLVALTRTLAVQNLTFQGHSDRLYEPGNGNFLKFIELMGMFDGVMKERLQRITSNDTHIHYLGKNIQNELIDLLASKIRGKILSMVKESKYYSVILDCMLDISHMEQIAMIVRFVSTRPGNVEIQECFLAFVKLDDSSGEGMTEVLLQKLNEMGLPLADMRGQSYDNGANMKGKNKEVQKWVRELNSRAFFVPCNTHSLNLILSDAAGCCTDAVNFGVIQAIFVYFSLSTYQWDILLKHVVKQLSETRWGSRVEAARAIRYDALLSIADDTMLTGTCGTKSHAEARSITGKVLNFKFLCSLVVWHDILFEVNIASKTLQVVEFDLHQAIEQLAVLQDFLQNYRLDHSFVSVLAIAQELAESLSIQQRFAEEIQKKTQFDYKTRDEPVVNPEQSFKVNFFYVLYKIPELSSSSHEVLFEQCTDLQSALMDGDSKDIDASELCDE
uniref:TTF-type domain-containing protein n=1 Tax=Latimeria chalumnae TaxID=7897 RepID=H3A856_LATCH